jgi:uncharacterized membrane protein YcfT
MMALAVWALTNGLLVGLGVSELPLVSLALGGAGAAAVIVVAVLIARVSAFDPIRYCGENSIVIYLGFFLPMAATRTLLLKSGIIGDIGMVSLIVTTVGIVGALAMWWAARRTPLSYLYVRPDGFRLVPGRRPSLQPAE